MRRITLGMLLIVCPGCGDDRGLDPDTGTPQQDASNAYCGFVSELDRSCTGDGSCAFGVHATDCCGNTAAVAFNAIESGRFAVEEPACAASYPLCECPSGPTTTDSGETTMTHDAIRVACVPSGPANICMTYVDDRPPGAP
jgi:hypothetical protein